jgi:hypothetical protein
MKLMCVVENDRYRHHTDSRNFLKHRCIEYFRLGAGIPH